MLRLSIELNCFHAVFDTFPLHVVAACVVVVVAYVRGGGLAALCSHALMYKTKITCFFICTPGLLPSK